MNSLRTCGAVGWVSFQEIIRDKILYNILVLALLLLGLGFIATRLTFLRPDRVILDFGLTAVNLSCTMIAIFTGASVIGREFERRTIFVALSRPISKFEFLLGKYAGVSLVILMNWVLLSLVYLAILGMASASLEGGVLRDFHPALALGMVLVLIQSWLLAALALMFSTFSTTSLSAVFTLGLYLVGNNVDQLRFLASRLKGSPAEVLLDFTASILPDLGTFNLGTKVTYGLPVGGGIAFHSVLYGVVFTALALAMAGWFIERRES